MKALGLAHHWQRLLDEGRFHTLSETAAAEQIDKGQASDIIRLAQLAPDIVETCLAGEGNVPALENLSRAARPADWGMQRYRAVGAWTEDFPIAGCEDGVDVLVSHDARASSLSIETCTGMGWKPSQKPLDLKTAGKKGGAVCYFRLLQFVQTGCGQAAR